MPRRLKLASAHRPRPRDGFTEEKACGPVCTTVQDLPPRVVRSVGRASVRQTAVPWGTAVKDNAMLQELRSCWPDPRQLATWTSSPKPALAPGPLPPHHASTFPRHMPHKGQIIDSQVLGDSVFWNEHSTSTSIQTLRA